MRNLLPHFIYEEQQAGRTSGELDAAALFVDISGFTGLTRSFIKDGKRGAEDLANILNQILSAFVSAVYQNGGFIINFAGDGFTALFPGEDRAVYAAQAAFAMQMALQRTHAQELVLDGRVGLGIGQTFWHILGENQQMFYFRGESISTCMKAQKRAQRGEIIAAPEVKPHLENFVDAEVVDGFLRLTRQRNQLPERLTLTSPLTTEFLSHFGLEEISKLNVIAEFRDTANVFITVGEDPDDKELASFTIRVLQGVSSYRGYFNKVEFSDKGCVFLIVFGAPLTYGNSLKRAANFLLSLREEHMLKWRAGLTYGTAYAGFVGDNQRSEYTVLGDPVNLASRLMEKATKGQIWTEKGVVESLTNDGYVFETWDRILS